MILMKNLETGSLRGEKTVFDIDSMFSDFKDAQSTWKCFSPQPCFYYTISSLDSMATDDENLVVLH